MIDNFSNLSQKDKKEAINQLLRDKITSLLARIDCHPEHNTAEVLDKNECPLDLPEQLLHEFHEFLKPIFIEIKGANANLEEITDSWLKYASWAIRYKDDATFAYEDAERRTLLERITRTNSKDILLYKQAQYRLAEYMLRAMARDFLEDAW